MRSMLCCAGWSPGLAGVSVKREFLTVARNDPVGLRRRTGSTIGEPQHPGPPWGTPATRPGRVESARWEERVAAMKRPLAVVGTLALTVGVLAGTMIAPAASASSHREAPSISKDPTAD